MKYGLLLLGVVVLSLFIKNLDFTIIYLSLNELGLFNITFLISLTLINVILKALRWKFLVYKVSHKSISLPFSFSSILAGVTGGSFIPGKVELAKPLMLHTKYDIKLSQSLSTLTIERILDFFILLLIISSAILFMPTQKIISISLVLLFMAVLIGVTSFLTFYPKPFIRLVQHIISRLPLSEKNRSELHNITDNLFCGFVILKSKSAVVISTILSLFTNGTEVLRFYFLLQLLGVNVSLAVTGFAFAVSIIIGVLTMIPGGIGITELSASQILSTLLPSSPQVLIRIAVLIDRLIAYYLLLFLGSFVLIFYDKVFKPGFENIENNKNIKGKRILKKSGS